MSISVHLSIRIYFTQVYQINVPNMICFQNISTFRRQVAIARVKRKCTIVKTNEEETKFP